MSIVAFLHLKGLSAKAKDARTGDNNQPNRRQQPAEPILIKLLPSSRRQTFLRLTELEEVDMARFSRRA
jgi:hypothetical protein